MREREIVYNHEEKIAAFPNPYFYKRMGYFVTSESDYDLSKLLLALCEENHKLIINDNCDAVRIFFNNEVIEDNTPYRSYNSDSVKGIQHIDYTRYEIDISPGPKWDYIAQIRAEISTCEELIKQNELRLKYGRMPIPVFPASRNTIFIRYAICDFEKSTELCKEYIDEICKLYNENDILKLIDEDISELLSIIRNSSGIDVKYEPITTFNPDDMEVLSLSSVKFEITDDYKFGVTDIE